MTARSRTFIFPGGMLQVAAYDDDSEDDPGVYLQLYNDVDATGEGEEGGAGADSEVV
ncbi:hypothetical protein IU500_00620 [Nocardia terpenica]|uniref:hypothetical protein n=1 Tax=Nocardia terpenica TaxID=455432 RepID=UPI000B08C706|nr:hypothetical protein [Nocardia terpenica]MBF6059922.1 hypothetical protein [Nocardia terpenica]MBF6102537.1 hypothetical protein [Nocardia terpenica]MBF6111272.1 hypothetical protein [Nocardia terpenica]MBF6117403.1 hypothetical protein [Nocardia terpenica]MBF6150756.1 hypothetical protein [Nocardia terpenica]